MKKLIIILLFLFSVVLQAQTKYYVKNGGSDAASGLDDDNAWETLTYAMSQIAGGDSLFLNEGDTWRETMTISQSGTSDAYTYIGNYGTGARPLILGSIQATTWTETGTANVWESATVVPVNPYNPTPAAEVFFDESGAITWGVYHVYSDLSELTEEYDWTWNADVLYVYAATDPDARYTSVEAPQRDNGIYFNNKEYLTFDSLDVRYCQVACFRETYPSSELEGLVIKYCNISHVGIKEGNSSFGGTFWHSECYFQNNDIHNCGRRAISLNVDAAVSITLDSIFIENNHFYDCFHTTGPDIANQGGSVFTTFVIRNNLFDQTTFYATNYIYTENTSTGSLNDFQIYNNIFKNACGKAITMASVQTSIIYNNTFYGVNATLTTAQGFLWYTGTNTGSVVRNNIFYNNSVYATNQYYNSVFSVAASLDGLDLDYNLYYNTDADVKIVNILGTGYYKQAEWAAMKAATGWEANSPTPADPTFVSAVDYHLQAGSPAIAAGYGVGIALDYDGSLFADVPAIGALEYNVTPPDPPAPPHVHTYVATTVRAIWAFLSGYADGTSLTAKGFVYSTSPNPTLADAVVYYSGADGPLLVFVMSFKGGTTYYYRAFGTNATTTSYGENYIFTMRAFGVITNGAGKYIMSGGKAITEDNK